MAGNVTVIRVRVNQNSSFQMGQEAAKLAHNFQFVTMRDSKVSYYHVFIVQYSLLYCTIATLVFSILYNK